MKIIIFGAHGWIGQQFIKLLSKSHHELIIPDYQLRVDNTHELNKYLLLHKPTHVVSLIGRMYGKEYNTIDYLELPGKLRENINDNLYAPLSLALICKELNIHYTYMGSGCIFNEINVASHKFNENDEPNFFGSSYSTVKGFTDRLMHLVPEVLNIRIRMPITNEEHPRNFITKISNYKKICSVYNSMTVLPTLLPFLEKMMTDKITGTINFTNPGIISHNQILQLYKEYIDPSFTWENFTIQEHDQVLLAARSNNQLDTTRLETLFPNVLHIKDAIKYCFIHWKNTLDYHTKVIITGGCGALGSQMINYFKKKYTNTIFINIDALTYCGKKENISHPFTNYKFHHTNILNKQQLYNIFLEEQPTLLIHLAAETHVDKSFDNSLQFTESNVLGTHILLEVAKMYGKFKKIIHMSTDEVYGSTSENETPCLETQIFAPSNPYAASKASAELICHSYIKSFKLPIIITRCNNIISKYQNSEKLIPKCIECINSNQPIPIQGDGSSKRTFIHSLDVSKAIEYIIQKGNIYDIYNIGTNMEYTVLEVVENILHLLKPNDNIKDWITFVDDRPFQDYRYSIDSTKIRQLGWKETFTFTKALKDILN